jgi:hypothetical protein
VTLTVPLHSQSGFRFDGTPVTQLRIISSLGGTEILRNGQLTHSVNILKGKIQAQCPRKHGGKTLRSIVKTFLNKYIYCTFEFLYGDV